MPDDARGPDHLDEISEWFMQRGYGIRLDREKDGLVWADLTRLASGRVVAPKYGRGETPLEAAQSAKRRFSTEQ